jgi:hypothetical protein
MRSHIRMDGIKVFEEDAKLLHLVMQEHKIKNKSEAWRITLQEYRKNRDITQSFFELKEEFTATRNEISQLKSTIEDLYFMIQTLSRGQQS